MNRLLVVLSVLCLAFAAAAQTNPIVGAWTLVFDDEFNGTALNTNLWNPSGWIDNPGELETYEATNVVVTNGLLQLWVYHPSSGVYTSGKVTTMDKFWQRYGYFEASINLPRVAGFWPAWWLLKEPYNTNDVSEPDWPPEVDILEIVGESGGAVTGQDCKVFVGSNYPLCGGGVGSTYDDVYCSLSDATTGFHTYGYRWTPTNHTFYQDGVLLGSTSEHPYTLYPMWAILQMAILSTPVGTLPAAMQVDYVRIWALTNQLPPIITSQPSTQTVVINTPATFSVTCTNALSYQWTMAGTNVTGATSSTWTYTPSAVQTQRVSVVVTNAYGGIQSGFVQLQAQVQVGSVAQIGVTPANASVVPGGQQQFSATGADLLGAPLVPQPSFTWSVSGGGTIDGTGLFTAGSVAGGPFNVAAASGGIMGMASVSVVAASGGTIGNTKEGTSTDTMWDNGAWINASRFLASSNMAVSAMYAKVTTIAGGYKCAIYADNAGEPSGFVCGAAEVRNATNGWNVFPLTNSVVLTNGQYYWLAIWSDDTNAAVYYSDGSGMLRWGQYDYGSWPDPLSTSGGGNFDCCIYASGILRVAGPEPAGWYAGDMHVHRSCGSSPASVSSIYDTMASQDLAVVSLLADMGNGEVQDAATDLPLVNGMDASVSTAGRIVHWDAEWHWDATYTQYPHQALGGHVVALGLTNAYQIWSEYTYPIFDWARRQGGIAGFAHFQYLDDSFPQSLTCCTPIEYPSEVALGACDFISEDVTGSDSFIHAYYRLLNCGFRPGFVAGSDWPCGPAVGPVLTYAQVAGGQLTYSNWLQGIAKGRTVVSRNGRNEFVALTVNGTATPGDEIQLTGGGSVQVTVQWTANQSLSGSLELVCNGQVAASAQASVAAGAPASLNATVSFAKSGWLCARRMSGSGHQVHTAAVFVIVDHAPVRASAVDAQFYAQWMDTLLQNTSPGGIWSSYFVTDLVAAQARYSAAKVTYQQIAAEAGGVQQPAVVSIGNSNEGAFTDSMWDNGAWINASRVLVSSNLAVSSIHAKVAAIAGGYKCAIYTDNAGKPSGFVCGTAEVRNATNGWNVFPLTNSVVLTNGQYYWLAIWSDDTNAAVYYSDSSGTLCWGQYDYGSWPDLLSTSGDGNFDYCIYASGILTIQGPSLSIVWDISGGGSLYIVGRGIPYWSYTIEYSEGLEVPLWQPAATVVADGAGVVEFVEAPPSGSASRFYRASAH
jgi:beta-glucanase (GH16 family)